MYGVYGLEEVMEMARESGFPALPEVADALDALYGWTNPDWREVFAATQHAKEAIEHLEREAVRLARLDGLSWEEIGDELDITGQGARKRYARPDLEELEALDELHEAETEAIRAEMKLASARARNEMRSDYESDEELNRAVTRRVVINGGYFQRQMELGMEHFKARHELASRLRK